MIHSLHVRSSRGNEALSDCDRRRFDRSLVTSAATVEGHVTSAARFGFTLIEIMVVVGIMGLILLMGVPLIYRVWHKEPMRQAISGVVEVLSNARARAIMQGKDVAVVFHPREHTLEVEGAGGGASGSGMVTVGLSPGAGGGTSTKIPDEVQIEMLDVNLTEYKDSESARVVFTPRGTCDEMTLIMRGPNWWRKISLEITTGLASVGEVR